MKITRYGHLVQLTRLGAFNSHIVIEEDSLTLVDTNFAGSASGILKAAAQLNKPVKRIVLTHADPDHVGSLDALRAALPDVEVMASAREAERMSSAPDRFVSDGDGVGSLRVIATPGHTPGHIALLDTRDNTLIAGDAFGTMFKVAVSGMLIWRFPFSALVTWHKPTALASAKKLRALDPARLVVGHGPVIEAPAALMDAAIAAAEQAFKGEPGAVSSTG